MSLLNSNSIVVGIAAFLVVVCWRLGQTGRRPKDYPPGPPTLPLIGNLHQIPSEKRHIQFQKWAREYGPIYSLMLGTKCMIVLSSDVAIKDLVDKRGAIYSSRPEAYIAQDVLSGGLRVLFMVFYLGPTACLLFTIAGMRGLLIDVQSCSKIIQLQVAFGRRPGDSVTRF